MMESLARLLHPTPTLPYYTQGRGPIRQAKNFPGQQWAKTEIHGECEAWIPAFAGV
ncbi:hypothetical protein [Dyella nitratireducens]|uniref:Transposase n=1 Tax=Dyella nitratireducens TaxID=1849580 RepID=A0ABQ1FJZ1_9GAMM|nr:hypothetical protein [Dyella nitratireducens]GGA19400.1 hypothetical protein GCM10010981_04250 [Dyella nitratireducens]GLQ44514.1 hypothetical protein GCM10007902_43640 [Dyella nitratireducens]